MDMQQPLITSAMKRFLPVIVMTVLAGWTACTDAATVVPAATMLPVTPISAVHPSTLKVNVTQQGFSARIPWQKLSPNGKSGLGVLIEGQKVLVTASLVQDASYVELELPASGRRIAAKVHIIDLEANLALLEADPGQGDMLKGLRALPLHDQVLVGDTLEVWQLGRSGELLISPLVVNKVLVSRYLLPSSSLLTLEANGILRAEATNVTLPLIKQGQLAGLLLRYDSRNQSATVIPSVIIRRFLKDAADGSYEGFPTIGLTTHGTLDSQFRDYLGLTNEPGGLFVGAVSDGGSAKSLGIQAGDILISVNGHSVDSRGDVQVAELGTIHYSHLLRGERFVGEVAQVQVQRAGQRLLLQGRLVRKNLLDYTVPSIQKEEGPNFLVHGGLVFQELSMPYLQSFGEQWETHAPPRLSGVASNPAEFEKQGHRRIVFLSAVLPVTGTQGYQSLGGIIVTRINGVDIKDLRDLQSALQMPDRGIHRIEFDEAPRAIYLSETQAQADNRDLAKASYRIGQLMRID